MFAKTYGATTLGIDGRIIDVEVDVSPGLPGFELVGLPDTSVKESKERVRTAIRNSGIQLRQERVMVNLAPADVRKDSSGLDLPIAVGLLASYGMVPEAVVQNALFSAELSLDGNCRPISGILPMAMIGGGSIPRPGEVTLAHHGVLFLDELPEFSKKTLEVLREPIEDRQINVSRANATLTFPSSIILVAAMNEVTSITIQCNDKRNAS